MNMLLPSSVSSSTSSINEQVNDSPSIPLDEVKQLVDLGIIKQQLAILDKEETKVDLELEALLNRQTVLESFLKRLESLK
jgi:DNA-binding Lrp family transcriptional regulator